MLPPIVVSAWVSGAEINRMYLDGTYYQLLLETCVNKGIAVKEAVIQFSIVGFWAKETIVLEGGAKAINLTKTNYPVVSTP